MMELEFVKSTFEYVLRKAINDGILPLHGQCINSIDSYYEVDWQGVEPQQLWDRLVDEEKVASIPEDEHISYFKKCINYYIDGLKIIDPKYPETMHTLGELEYFIPVKKIPKKYYRK